MAQTLQTVRIWKLFILCHLAPHYINILNRPLDFIDKCVYIYNIICTYTYYMILSIVCNIKLRRKTQEEKHTHTHACLSIYLSLYIFISIYIDIYTHTHTDTHRGIYIYIHACMHTFIHSYIFRTIPFTSCHDIPFQPRRWTFPRTTWIPRRSAGHAAPRGPRGQRYPRHRPSAPRWRGRRHRGG